jgi:membrane-associated phospholipid phosphatase
VIQHLVLPASGWVEANLPVLDTLIIGISALGSGWFVALAFAALGLLALSRGRRDLAFLLALGTLCFPMEWALKYFTSADAISLPTLLGALFDVNGIGLDDIADFPAGHALRATVLYGLAAFCVARLAHDVRQGVYAYVVAGVLIGAISATRIYLGAHFPLDVLGGWIAGAALLSILVAVHVLRVDERAAEREMREKSHVTATGPRRVAVPRRRPPATPREASAPNEPVEG